MYCAFYSLIKTKNFVDKIKILHTHLLMYMCEEKTSLFSKQCKQTMKFYINLAKLGEKDILLWCIQQESLQNDFKISFMSNIEIFYFKTYSIPQKSWYFRCEKFENPSVEYEILWFLKKITFSHINLLVKNLSKLDHSA